MTKTSNEVCTRALRDLGVVAIAESPEAEELADAKLILQGVLDDFEAVNGRTIASTIDTIPDSLYLSVAMAVAAMAAASYSIAGPSYKTALWRIRTTLLADDREDRADTNSDGTVSAEEANADLRAQYY